MTLVVRFVRSSLGKKYLMALTGIGLLGFVIAHMIGNLQFFLGREAINRYAHFLQSTPEILWPARIGLLAMVLVHLWAATMLVIENRAARKQQYDRPELVAASLASRTMAFSGLIVFAFVVYHLLHFTAQTTNPEFRNLHDALGRHDVYEMMVAGFSDWCASSFYIIGVGLLCFHLSHGASAMFQSLGLKSASYECVIDCAAKIVAGALFLGYVSIPLYVLIKFQ